MSTDDQACEVPFVEQLRSIPKDYRTCRAIQWSDDGRETGHQLIPVGFMMHRAADEIERLQSAASPHEADQRDAAKWRALMNLPREVNEIYFGGDLNTATIENAVHSALRRSASSSEE